LRDADICQDGGRWAVTSPVLRVAVIFLALLSLAPAVSAAGAATTTAPPGQSAIDEYLETVPGDSGNTSALDRKPGATQPGAGEKAASALPVKVRKELKRSGADGKAAAALATAFAPDDARPVAGDDSSAVPHAGAAGSQSSGGVLPAITSAATGTDGGGSSALFPALLIAILFGGLTVGVLRRRGGGAPA
jgi:hypothetical protein